MTQLHTKRDPHDKVPSIRENQGISIALTTGNPVMIALTRFGNRPRSLSVNSLQKLVGDWLQLFLLADAVRHGTCSLHFQGSPTCITSNRTNF